MFRRMPNPSLSAARQADARGRATVSTTSSSGVEVGEIIARRRFRRREAAHQAAWRNLRRLEEPLFAFERIPRQGLPGRQGQSLDDPDARQGKRRLRRRPDLCDVRHRSGLSGAGPGQLHPGRQWLHLAAHGSAAPEGRLELRRRLASFQARRCPGSEARSSFVAFAICNPEESTVEKVWTGRRCPRGAAPSIFAQGRCQRRGVGRRPEGAIWRSHEGVERGSSDGARPPRCRATA